MIIITIKISFFISKIAHTNTTTWATFMHKFNKPSPIIIRCTHAISGVTKHVSYTRKYKHLYYMAKKRNILCNLYAHLFLLLLLCHDKCYVNKVRSRVFFFRFLYTQRRSFYLITFWVKFKKKIVETDQKSYKTSLITCVMWRTCITNWKICFHRFFFYEENIYLFFLRGCMCDIYD